MPHQATKFRPNRTSHSGVMMSYTISRWRQRWLKTTSGFVFDNATFIKVKIYPQTKLRRRISNCGWDTTTSSLGKQTSAILEFFFRLPLLPYHSNRRDILHQTTKFHPNRTTHSEIWRHIHFLSWRPLSLNITSVCICWWHCLQKVFKGLSANQISSTYLNWRLRCNYFRFWKINVRHIGILFLVSISTTSL